MQGTDNSFILLRDQVGTKRDKFTVDATTNRINSLLFKVNQKPPSSNPI